MFDTGRVSTNPPKNDAWNDPAHWYHTWVRFDRSNFPPMPGLILDWHHQGPRWKAWAIWLDHRGSLRTRPTQGWVESKYLRPAKSDINIWNDGPWR